MMKLLASILFLIPLISFSQDEQEIIILPYKSRELPANTHPKRIDIEQVECETVEAPALSKKEKDSLFNAYQIEEVGIEDSFEENGDKVVNTMYVDMGDPAIISPEYPGGPVAMSFFINSNFIYPVSDTTTRTGTVWVEFTIDSLGVVDNAIVRKGLTPLIDEEAKRVVEKFPNFIPGSIAGKKVAVQYTVPVKVKKIPTVSAMSPNPIHIYDACESNAEFFGGEKAMESFIKQNLKYPKEAQKKHQEGTVYVEFTVLKNGELADIRILKGVSPSLNKEAIRLIKMMPNWIAYERSGVLYESSYILPILFQLK